MAVTERIDSKLQLVFHNGYDPVSEKEVQKTKAFNNIKPDATSAQLLSVAKALSALQELELLVVKRNDTEILTED